MNVIKFSEFNESITTDAESIKKLKGVGKAAERNTIMKNMADYLAQYNLIVKYDTASYLDPNSSNQYIFTVNTLPMYFQGSRDALSFYWEKFTEEQMENIDSKYNKIQKKFATTDFYSLEELVKFFKKYCGIYGNPKLANTVSAGILEKKLK